MCIESTMALILPSKLQLTKTGMTLVEDDCVARLPEIARRIKRNALRFSPVLTFSLPSKHAQKAQVLAYFCRLLSSCRLLRWSAAMLRHS